MNIPLLNTWRSFVHRQGWYQHGDDDEEEEGDDDEDDDDDNDDDDGVYRQLVSVKN